MKTKNVVKNGIEYSVLEYLNGDEVWHNEETGISFEFYKDSETFSWKGDHFLVKDWEKNLEAIEIIIKNKKLVDICQGNDNTDSSAYKIVLAYKLGLENTIKTELI